MSRAEELRQHWQSRLQDEHPKQSSAVHQAIMQWLIGRDLDRFEELPAPQWAIAKQAMDYRYNILQQRYLGKGPDAAYRALLQRLASLSLVRNKIRTWVSLSRDRQRSVMDVLQEVIQELIQGDKYIREQIDWIAECTGDRRIRNCLLLATIEEYCLRPIRNQPLLVYRFVNYLRRLQRGGMTQVPSGDIIRMVSDEISSDDSEGTLSLTDLEALDQYQEQQAWEEQQIQRNQVLQEFLTYLEAKVDPIAPRWLELHVQGKTQEAIAQELGLPVKQVYRLREKISYHAKNVFAAKLQPELVASWLGTSIEQNMGLSPQLWEQFYESRTDAQKQLIEDMKTHGSLEAVANARHVKLSQLKSEWTKLYLEAHALRSASPPTQDETE